MGCNHSNAAPFRGQATLVDIAVLQLADIDVALFNYGLHYHTEQHFREVIGG